MKVCADSDRKNIGVNKSSFRLGSKTKIDEFRNLLQIFSLIIFLYSSMLGADAFRTIIQNRLEEMRSKSSNLEQTGLILQPSFEMIEYQEKLNA